MILSVVDVPPDDLIDGKIFARLAVVLPSRAQHTATWKEMEIEPPPFADTALRAPNAIACVLSSSWVRAPQAVVQVSWVRGEGGSFSICTATAAWALSLATRPARSTLYIRTYEESRLIALFELQTMNKERKPVRIILSAMRCIDMKTKENEKRHTVQAD